VRFGGGVGDGDGAEEAEEEEEEVFTWNKVTTLVSNLILGPLAVAHAGTMRVRSSATGAVWPLRFRDALPPSGGGGKDAMASSSASSGAGAVVRGALEPGGAVIAGTWWGSLTLEVPPPDGAAGAAAVTAQPLPPQHAAQLWRRSGALADGRAGDEYRWSAFAAGLNELPPAAAATSPAAPASGDASSAQLLLDVCPTDSRLRPDQRLLEQGRYGEANAAKQRLEERQRAARQRRTAPPPPRWFRPAPPPLGAAAQQGGGGGEELWYEFTGGYWEAHAARQGWGDAPRIFD
jgi:hypothetical protein